MTKLKNRRYYLIYWGIYTIVAILLIPLLIITGVNWFVTIMAMIIAIIVVSSCIAVYRHGYKNVPPPVTFPIGRMDQKGNNDYKLSFSEKKKRKKNH